MTQEIKLKLEQAADALFEHKGYSFTPCDYAMRKGFLAGAQTILENPIEWGLCSLEVLEATSVSVGKAWADNDRLKSQLTKYREALEDVGIALRNEGFVNSTGEGVEEAERIVREALKHNEQ